MIEGRDTGSRQNRHASALQLSEELLSDIELSRCDAQQILLKASRLARLMRDEQAQIWMGYELNGYPEDRSVDAQITRTGRWLNKEKETAFIVPLSRILALADAEQSRIQAMRLSSVSGDYASVVARDQRNALVKISGTISRLRGIAGNVISLIHTWVTQTHQELLFSDLQAELFASVQVEIDGRLAPLAGSTLAKIESINERLRDGDPESISQAMSTCRRLIDAVADALFPPQDAPYQIGNIELSVERGNVLNRLQAYAAQRVDSKTRRDRLRRALADLYKRASTGTHADVDVVEARYLFLHTYVILGELLALNQDESSIDRIFGS